MTMARDQRSDGHAAAGYRLKVRLSAADVGSRVVIRWRRPAGDGEEIADVLGVLTVADGACFAVRKASGELVTIPRDRALAGKTVPAAPLRRQEQGSGVGESPGTVRDEGSSTHRETRHDDGAG